MCLGEELSNDQNEELKKHQEYSKGKMNGIEKRLLEIVDCK